MSVMVDSGPHGMIFTLCGVAILGSLVYILYSFFSSSDHPIISRINSTTASLLSSSSPSREKWNGSSPPQTKASDVDYSQIFPPSQRELLAQASPAIAAAAATASNGAQGPLLALEEDFRRADPRKRVFSGFTVGEIHALGDFPDYATLSGVPLPSPLVDFDITKAVPRPYRPFRWSYHQTMSFKKLDPDFWLELENTYVDRIRQRQQLFQNHGEQVLQSLPGSELACKELMEMSLQFLCTRYPTQFKLEEEAASGKGKGKVLVNEIMGTRCNLAEADPLQVLLDNVPEDFGIMLRDDKTGRYFFRAGVICSAVGWSLGQKIGLGLSGIHGPVPDYKEKMEFSMDRFFTKMPASSPIQRGSWGLEIGEPLYLPADHPDLAHRESQNGDLTVDDLHLRVDWQTLRRLPLSGAVIFNFKALFTPLREFRDEPYIPSLVLKVLNEGKENIMKYKGTWHVEHVAKPALEAYERWQIQEGMMPEGWTHQTLDENPFFPGWERKWTYK